MLTAYEVTTPVGKTIIYLHAEDGRIFDVYPNRAKLRRYVKDSVRYVKMTLDEYTAFRHNSSNT